MRNRGSWVLACFVGACLGGCSAGATGQQGTRMRGGTLVLGGETKHHVPILTATPASTTDAGPQQPRVDLTEVTERIFARASKLGFEKLSRQEQNVAAVWGLEADVNNGGFDQYFFNASSDLAATAPDALREIGAPDAAAIVDEAVDAFGSDGPASEQTERQQQLERLEPLAKRRWAELDQRFRLCGDDITALLKVYVNANADALL